MTDPGGAPARLRILHVDLHGRWSGGQRQLLLLAEGLARRGHRQRIATPPDGPLARAAAAAGIPVVPFAAAHDLDLPALFRLRRALARLAPDLVAAHDPHALALAALAARLLRSRPAVVAHRRVDFPLRGHALSRLKWARGPDRTVAVSRRVRDVLVAGGAPPGRIVVVPDAVDPAAPEPADLRALAGAPAGAPLVLTFAALVERKGHPEILDAAARLAPREPAARWVVCGDGPLLGSVRAAVARRGLVSPLVYPGFVPGARALLAGADAFVLASREEALGSSLLEAMAAGVPVVATAAGGVPEVVEDGRTGLLVPPGDAAALAAAVDRLLDDRALAARLAAAARAEVERRFLPGRMVAATEAAYRAAVSRLPFPAPGSRPPRRRGGS